MQGSRLEHAQDKRGRERFLADVIEGLGQPEKRLRPKYFYDEKGSALFDRITRLEEYYLTRTEMAILEEHGDEIAGAIGPQAVLLEYGSGSSAKTRILLDRLHDLAAYVPVDISCEHLERAADLLRSDYPELTIEPVCADYTVQFDLPPVASRAKRVVAFFPGSTLGNFEPDQADRFLRRVAVTVGESGALVLGVDLQKDATTLEAAYNDSAGVTAAFNLNLLERLNRELGADFVISAFGHEAVYDLGLGRIEMHLVSKRNQSVTIDGHTFEFAAGETIHTESSYKYTFEEIRRLSTAAGFRVASAWADARQLFCVSLLVRD